MHCVVCSAGLQKDYTNNVVNLDKQSCFKASLLMKEIKQEKRWWEKGQFRSKPI